MAPMLHNIVRAALLVGLACVVYSEPRCFEDNTIFATDVELFSDTGIALVSVGDIDSDNDTDIVAAIQIASDLHRVVWFENKGDGPTSWTHFIAEISSPLSSLNILLVDDMDGDAHNDVVVVTRTGFQVFLNNGSQNFEGPQVNVDNLAEFERRKAAIVGNTLNTRKDIVLGTEFEGEGLLWYHANHASEPLAYNHTLIPGTESAGIFVDLRVGNISERAFPDLITLSLIPPDSTALNRYSFSETENEFIFNETISTECWRYGGFGIGDVNGDHNIDIACRNTHGHLILLSKSDNGGAIWTEKTINDGLVRYGFDLADIDLDGDQDILYVADDYLQYSDREVNILFVREKIFSNEAF